MIFSEYELKLIKGCILTTRETFKMIPLKSQEIKDKIKAFDKLLEKFD